MTGTVDEIGSDIRKIKDMGIEHIVLGFFFPQFMVTQSGLLKYQSNS